MADVPSPLQKRTLWTIVNALSRQSVGCVQRRRGRIGGAAAAIAESVVRARCHRGMRFVAPKAPMSSSEMPSQEPPARERSTARRPQHRDGYFSRLPLLPLIHSAVCFARPSAPLVVFVWADAHSRSSRRPPYVIRCSAGRSPPVSCMPPAVHVARRLIATTTHQPWPMSGASACKTATGLRTCGRN